MHPILADAWGSGFHPWFLLFPLVWVLIFFLCFRFFAWRRGPWRGCGVAGVGTADPSAILAERYARGEITHDEYRERLGNLEK